MTEVPDAIVCESCDAVCHRRPLREREVARCPRCGAELDRHPGAQRRRILPLALAGLVVFAVANLFPIVEVELQGLRSRTTLSGAVVALGTGDQPWVAVLVLATTMFIPALQLLVLAWLAVQGSQSLRPRGFDRLVRAMRSLRPWGMVEVFMLSVLVALVKLSGLAQVVPGPALWALAALTVLLTVVLSVDPRVFWGPAPRGPA